MSNYHLNSVEYFQAPQNYFWKWAENGEVIEWTIGNKTICYKQDLIDILSLLPGGSTPPLSPVLLVIAACNTGFSNEEISTLRHYSFVVGGGVEHLALAIRFLSTIPLLPEDLRTGTGRAHLLNHIFKIPEITNFAPVELKSALNDLSSGQWQDQLQQPGRAISPQTFSWHLSYFENARRETPTLESLKRVLRTGIPEMPQAAPLAVPEPSGGDLFEQLSKHPELAALARLAERLIPVLNIPMHTQGSGQYPFGGISDITNRGSYDKLLLSELAQDDLTLTARLVNGEALYYRREEPPDKPTNRRILLIDATLKMWGIPRLFAMASALAFAHNLKKREETEAFVLEGSRYNAANLGDIKGIEQAMSMMHHALHCGIALQQFIDDRHITEEDELVLITDAQSYRSAAFMAVYSAAKECISYTIIVNRSGEINFKENIKDRLKQLGSAKLNLEEILSAPSIQRVSQVVPTGEMPAFYRNSFRPLLQPKVIHLEPLAYAIDESGALVINKNHQVLWMKGTSKGAFEILENIEKDNYRMLVTHGLVYCLVFNKDIPLVKLYSFDTASLEYKWNDLSNYFSSPVRTMIHAGAFYVICKNAEGKEEAYSLDMYGAGFLGKPQKLEKQESDEIVRTKGSSVQPARQNNIFHNYTRRISNYSAMFRTKFLSIISGRLVFGGYTLEPLEHINFLRLKENRIQDRTGISAEESIIVPKFSQNKKLRFSLRRFPDGSEALIDPRGYVHLKSSNKSLPEVSFVFISGYQTACWASDGKFCGADYFLSPQLKKEDELPSDIFYDQYIHPFIQHIMDHESATEI
ncbi:MAG: hypothetical protein J7578_10255 [Chitinophagaceae bacterium]|nr:hypothetical protein [Chitinophagaceae bacterium]